MWLQNTRQTKRERVLFVGSRGGVARRHDRGDQNKRRTHGGRHDMFEIISITTFKTDGGFFLQMGNTRFTDEVRRCR